MSPRVIAIRPRLLVTAFAAVALFANIHAATLIVTSTADDGSPGTLRAALAAAADGDVIDATGITGTIVLLPQLLTSSQLGVTKSVGIVGPGPDKLTIDGNQTSRVFRIFPGLDVVIDGFTIANGRASGAPPNSFPRDNGGGIYNDHSSLTVRNCHVLGNSADANGGGIYNDGSTSGSAALSVIDCTFSGNSSGFLDLGGGAIFNNGASSGSATLTVDRGTLSGNAAQGSGGGGGIYNFGGFSGNATAELNACTLSGNSAELGGGIFNYAYDVGGATFEISNSTLSGNTAQEGGGIANVGSGGSARMTVTVSTLSGNSAAVGGGAILNQSKAQLTAIACTLTGNSGPNGGGIFNDESSLHIGNTLLKAGAPGENIRNVSTGTVTSHGFNLSSDAAGGDASTGPGGFLSATGDQRNTDPMLGPLANNGGATLTHLPLPGSTAIDRGSSDSLVAFGITTDQRGFARTVDDPGIPNAFAGDGTDIGAVEVPAAPPPPPPAPVADVAVSFLGADKVSVKQGEVLTYTIAIRNFGPNTAPNVVVNSLLSSGTGFLNARATKGSFSTPPLNETGAVVWSLGDMANGSAEGAELIVSVLVKGKTTVTNLVTINSDADDPNAENNVASITTSVATGGSGGGGGGKKK